MITNVILLFFAGILLSVNGSENKSPPRIVRQPRTNEIFFQVSDSNNYFDETFSIECEATGEPAPRYRWIKNGKPFQYNVDDNRILQSPEKGTLFFSKPKDDDVGQYQCFAINELGVAASNSIFALKAELQPFKNALRPPSTLSGNAGDPYKLSCQPPDGRPQPKMYWVIQSNRFNFEKINNSRITADPEGNLWFSNLTRQDASDNFMYACAAQTSVIFKQRLGDRFLLNVLKTNASSSENKHPPVYQYATRKNEVAFRGKNVELFCIFGGTPLPQTVWSKNGKVIEESDRITLGNYGKSLIIESVDFEDEGTYTCDVSNGVGSAQSHSINLKLLVLPYFTEEPEFINAVEGETAEFRCAASGVPKPEITWTHNGGPIAKAPPNPRRKVNANSIVIEKLVKNDTGNYGCNATNSLGYVYKDVYVNVIHK